MYRLVAGLEAGSKYGGGGGGGGGGGPLAASTTSASAGPKSESALGVDNHHAAAKALTSTKVRRARHTSCVFECHDGNMSTTTLSYVQWSYIRRGSPAKAPLASQKPISKIYVGLTQALLSYMGTFVLRREFSFSACFPNKHQHRSPFHTTCRQ